MTANRVVVFALTLACAFVSSAQDKDILNKQTPSAQRVIVGEVAPVTVAAGKSTHVSIPFRVAPGFHINSNKPKSELLLATVMSLSPPTDVSVAKVTYPPGEDLTFSFAPTEPLNVYTGDFTINALVSPARSSPPGTYRVRGALKYQACDNRACYPPGQVPLAFDVKVLKAPSTKHRRNPAQSPHVHQ
ncbi:MAG: protein-disulfide reductase DsbD domain-containing protein [Terriglobales bacterium]